MPLTTYACGPTTCLKPHLSSTTLVVAMTNRTCGVCCHCGNGLLYDQLYIKCLFCDLTFCHTCQEDHPQNHTDGFRRLVDRSTHRDAPLDTKACTHCTTMVHCRADCTECDLHLCLDCFRDPALRDSLMEHEHDSFTVIRVPDLYCLEIYDTTCRSCKAGASLIHCGRCFEGIADGEMSHKCKTCLNKYDELPVYCDTCWPTARNDHDPTHSWAAIKQITKYGAGETYRGFRCLECFQELPLDPPTIARHAHSRFVWLFGNAEKENLAQGAARRCPRKAPRRILQQGEELHGKGMGCQCCWEQSRRGAKMYYCGSCGFTACAHCVESGTANHRHHLIPMRLQRTTPPDDFWRALVNGDARVCDQCSESYYADMTASLSCSACEEYDICQSCVSTLNIHLAHDCCTVYPEWTYNDPEPQSEEWFERQRNLAAAAIQKREQDEDDADDILCIRMEGVGEGVERGRAKMQMQNVLTYYEKDGGVVETVAVVSDDDNDDD
ncbi:hypothetical protein K432DRAFT_446464 [Lepidopterella palustris CBS 459.81]|uniref:Uncharacterized protein n=1 Tax=Lepidopterella palustris CBS 459.81 TaxID=1314670 RepID=A0A8E2E259_9PEZI|nr:hypothetical protein K432DRAFT_446464 [Lepidopterella palustris CBS 459.81]